MKKGFTLIELLVVVLIIGILSAVALPQYRKAVIKSKVVKGIVALNALEKAQSVYYLENGYYAQELDDLSIDVPRENLLFVPSQHFAQSYIVEGLRLELAWAWGAADERLRCLADYKITKEVCASFGGRKFRTDGSVEYWTIH